MKLPHVFGPGDLRVIDVDVPSAGPRDVVIQVASAGICGSDLGMVALGGVVGPTTDPVRTERHRDRGGRRGDEPRDRRSGDP